MRQSDIWQEMRKHLAEMKETMDSAVRKVPGVSSLLQGEYPPVSIYETAEELIVQADVPGVPRDNLNVTLKAGALTIEGKAQPDQYEGCDCRRKERVGAEFHREIALPAEVDEEAEPAASLESGVLTIRLGKKAQQMGRTIEVEVH